MTENADHADEKLSKVEQAKIAGNYLRGTIGEVLAGDQSHFEHDDVSLMKFHGIYQQDDRDMRKALRQEGEEKAYMYMVRLKLPGGGLTAGQYLGIDAMADDFGANTFRLTTRQDIQFHHVAKSNLKSLMRGLNDRLVTTLGGCGDIVRNVMCCPAPLGTGDRRALHEFTRNLSNALLPNTRAYYEIWLDGEKVVGSEDEPLYGKQYLPRKFKVGIAPADDNCVDIYSQDVGLVALFEHDRLTGFNLLVGGGLGLTHRKADTFARLADVLGYIEPHEAEAAVKAVVGIHRDFGNRAERRHARLKYIIHEWGLDRFRDEFNRRFGRTIRPPASLPLMGFQDHLGAHAQADGRSFYGIFVENGRVIDRDGSRLKSALKNLVTRLQPGIRITPQQNVLLTGLTTEAVEEVQRVLAEHGVLRPDQVSMVRRHSMACPALPTCGLALSDAERALPSLIDLYEKELEPLGLSSAEITVRMTGCPNGCARPYTADIAYVGRGPNKYDVFVGGRLLGDRLVDRYAENITPEESIDKIRPLLVEWAQNRNAGENLGDFYQRQYGTDERKQILTGAPMTSPSPA